MFPKAHEDRVSKTKYYNGKDTSTPNKKPTCDNCRKAHLGELLVRTRNCLYCGNSCNKIRDFPNVRGQYKVSAHDQASDSNDALKKTHFYYLCSRGEQETSSDVLTCMSKVSSIDAYALLDPAASI